MNMDARTAWEHRTGPKAVVFYCEECLPKRGELGVAFDSPAGIVIRTARPMQLPLDMLVREKQERGGHVPSGHAETFALFDGEMFVIGPAADRAESMMLH